MDGGEAQKREKNDHVFIILLNYILIQLTDKTENMKPKESWWCKHTCFLFWAL